MGFYDDTKQNSENRRGAGTVCATGTLLTKVDPDIAAEIVEAFADPDILTVAIAESLKDIGYDISSSSVGRHRHGKCKCPVS